MNDDKRPVLLYVEDEFLTQFVVETALRDAGYDVRTASNGHDAIAALTTTGSAFDALLTDVDLGECPNGWQVARAAREIFPALPVVYVSGASASAWQAQGVRGSLIVAKPFAPDQIIDAMASLCVRGSG